MDHLSASSLGILQVTGASEEQRRHLEFLSVPLAEAVEAKDIAVCWPMGHIDGHRPRSPFHTAALERLLLAGLRDRGSDATKRVGLHLLRNAPADGPGSVRTEFDVVSLALLEDMGVSPAWLLLISALLGGDALVITDGGTCGQILIRQTLLDQEPIMELSIQLGHDVVWNGEGVQIRRSLPETLAITLPGRMLRDVVSHPVLDRFDLTIQEVLGDADPVRINVGHVPYEPIAWQ